MPPEPTDHPATADAKRSKPPEVILYTRDACHLCEDARRDLVSLREEIRFELREVDITSDDRLHSTYLERIPVVEIGGEIVAELVLNVDAVRRRLHTVSG